jgi:hypothetical protein
MEVQSRALGHVLPSLIVPIDVRGDMTSKEVDVDVVETGRHLARASSVRARVSDAMPLIGLSPAVMLTQQR